VVVYRRGLGMAMLLGGVCRCPPVDQGYLLGLRPLAWSQMEWGCWLVEGLFLRGG
jgi:hypothetical protein